MFDHVIPDSGGTALERRNFDYLHDGLAVHWRVAFLGRTKARVPPPSKVVIELLNSCNLDCPMCRVGEYGVNYDRRLPFHTFRSVLDQLPGLTTVRLNGLGESTLLPDFSAYVDFLIERRLQLELISNGSGRPRDYETILNAGGHVIVSWDAAERITFEKLRRPAHWEDSLVSLSHIATFATRSPGRCSLIFTLQPGNVGHLTPLIGLAARQQVSALIVNVAKLDNTQWLTERSRDLRADLATAAVAAEHAGIALYLPNQIGGVTTGLKGYRTCGEGCDVPWGEAVIRWNGDVQPCNMFNPFTYGNIHIASFQDIWNNAFADLFRRQLNSPHKHPYCEHCAYIEKAYA